jgi:hypothetical protein
LQAANEAKDISLSIATTNYDRAIEIAASRAVGAPLRDGFEDFAGREFAEWTGDWTDGNIALFKLHGSTDWYRGDQDRIIKLRHPMPLYGGLRVMPKESDKAVSSALVLPSREKIVTHPPFQEISYGFRRRAEEAEMLVFVGSSLRDPHIRDVCRKYSARKPVFAVSRSGNFASDVLPESAKVIRETASRFLISTMPRFMRTQDASILRIAAQRTEKDESAVLDWLVLAKNVTARAAERCEAIERLADADVPLLKDDLLALVNDRDPEVSTFALGLVQRSADRDEIIDAAQNTEARSDMFAEELRLLRSLV